MTKEEKSIYERILKEIRFGDRQFDLGELAHHEAYTATLGFLKEISEEAGCHGYLFIVSVTKLEERYGEALLPLLWEILDGFLFGNDISADTAFTAFYNIGLHYARHYDEEKFKKLLAPARYTELFYRDYPLTYEVISRYFGISGMYARQRLSAECALKRLGELAKKPAAERTSKRGFTESCKNVAVKVAYAAATASYLERCYLRGNLTPTSRHRKSAAIFSQLPREIVPLLESAEDGDTCGVTMRDIKTATAYINEALRYNPDYPKYPYLKAMLIFFSEVLAGRKITAATEAELMQLLSSAQSKESPSASDYEIRIARYIAFRALVQNHVAAQDDKEKLTRSLKTGREKLDIINSKQCPPAQYRPRLGCTDFEDYVFISYSTKDFKPVYVDILEMAQQGIRYWYDRGTIPGEKWYETVENRIKNAACVICYLSKDFMISEAVYKELNFIKKYDKPVICIDLTGQKSISRAVADVMRNGSREIAEKLNARTMEMLFSIFDEDAVVIARSREPEITIHTERLCGVLAKKFNATIRRVTSESGTAPNDITYADGGSRPNEDSFFADDKNKVYIVADGISRKRDEYARYGGSIAADIAKTLCSEMGGRLGRNMALASGISSAESLLAEAFEAANKSIAELIESRKERYAGTERPGCVCIAALIADDKLVYGSAGDCMGILVRGNQTLVFSQKQTTFAFDLLGKERDRELLMERFVNCPENEFGYGVANGDPRAAQCFKISHIDLEYGDTVYLISDGLSNFIQYSDGKKINEMSIEQIMSRSAEQDYAIGAAHCDDKTIVRIHFRPVADEKSVPDIAEAI